MDAWWESSHYRPGMTASVFLIQVDLEGHSEWAASQRSVREPAFQRSELAFTLKFRLRHMAFDLLHWLGDGGIFARADDGTAATADSVVYAADEVFDVFRRFKDLYKDSTQNLSLRVTATREEVVLGVEPGHWFGTGLNDFMKHEREYGVANAFTITEKLKLQLESTVGRFQQARQVHIYKASNAN